MARRNYVVEGAILECTLGTAPGEMVVTSQQKVKIKGKLKATSEDKIPKPPFFGSCTCSSPNPPCSPVLKHWQLTSKRSVMGDKTFLMADSKVQCEKGGMVTVKDVGQKLVGTGREDLELDEKYPELKGEIIFANGYLSSSLGGMLNAVLDLNPDEPGPNLLRGWNTNVDDPIDESNIYLDSELERTNAMTPEEIEKERLEKERKIIFLEEKMFVFPLGMSPMVPVLPTIALKVPEVSVDIPKEAKGISLLTQQEMKSIFWGYWNQIGNYKKGSQTYAEYFNAENNEHFLNGSYGLGSNAAHRMDHGIAQGYQWAMHQWGIISKEEVDDTKEKVPYIESYSPAYKPLTIVMHSQGNAPGVGFALGAMKYANELGWNQMALNLVFLGVHQPQGLWDKDYDDFIKVRTKHHHADSDFWDTFSEIDKAVMAFGSLPNKAALALSKYLLNQGDRSIWKYLNGISELFSAEHHKLRNKRGIYEHLKAITDFDAIKDRAVQFTFSNDHADIVCRDGDIPEIDSACNPAIDTTLFSVEFFNQGLSEKNFHRYDQQKKEVFELEGGGQVVIPPYAAVPRVSWEEKPKGKKKAGESNYEKKYFKDYRSVAKDWGMAMDGYRTAKKAYEKAAGRKFKLSDLIFPAASVYREAKERILLLKLNTKHRECVFHYARIQMADLYAHFSPVEFIHDEDILKSPNFDDGLGNKNIWERIKKVGEGKFYRVEYDKNPEVAKKMSSEAKRKRAKKYVEGSKSKKLLISTVIADTEYISNVLNAYVHQNVGAGEQLYEEPALSEKEQNNLNRLLKQFGETQKYWQSKTSAGTNEEFQNKKQVERDNTLVDLPKPPIKNN